MRGWRLVFAGAVAVGLLWLLRTPAPTRPLYKIEEAKPASDLGTAFDPARCGSVRVRVARSGPVPTVEPIPLFRVFAPPASKESVPNPNAPRGTAGGLADAVVYLARVDLARSRAWTLPPVSVEVRRSGMVVNQGDRPGSVAIVRRGGAVDLVSREAIDPVTNLPLLHSIRGRGAAFFTQMLPEPDKPVRRELPDEGFVELSSGSGYYWLRGYLFVSEHPYAAVTGTDGTFELKDVPDGDYDLVCWKANWRVERTEPDPELVGPARLFFRPPVEKWQRVHVVAGQVTDASFTLAAEDFAAAK